MQFIDIYERVSWFLTQLRVGCVLTFCLVNCFLNCLDRCSPVVEIPFSVGTAILVDHNTVHNPSKSRREVFHLSWLISIVDRRRWWSRRGSAGNWIHSLPSSRRRNSRCSRCWCGWRRSYWNICRSCIEVRSLTSLMWCKEIPTYLLPEKKAMTLDN
jgi:hypothetical protein